MEGDEQAQRILLVTRFLEKVRARDGLTRAHLRKNHTLGTDVLYELESVRRRLEMYPQAGREAAVVDVVHDHVAQLEGTHRIIADAILSLHTLAARYSAAGVSGSVLRQLYSPSVGTRRETLLHRWSVLHRALGSEAPLPPPSDRTLRGRVEPATLALLAEKLCPADVDRSMPRARVHTSPGLSRTAGEAAKPRVLVIGGAVIDVEFRTIRLPQPQTSSEATGFGLDPGGKGLTQAVAAARLGLETSLAAAVGDDPFGREVLDLLDEEHIDGSLIKVVKGARTPVTAVIGYNPGESIAVNWRNERDVHLDRSDLDSLLATASETFDAILLTFEPPPDLVEHVLVGLHRSGTNRPTTVVTPAPPYIEYSISDEALAGIDYLVGQEWELKKLAEAAPHLDLEALGSLILSQGIGTLCVTSATGCGVFSRDLGTFVVSRPATLNRITVGARDAFVAALTCWLSHDRPFGKDGVRWAAAAMSFATRITGTPRSMPTRDQIENRLT